MRRLLALALLCAGCASSPVLADKAATTPSTTATPTTITPAGWRAMAPAPLRGRTRPASVWTGTEFIVVGGYRDDEAKPGEPARAATSDGRRLAVTDFVDGAAYDPRTDRWRSIASVPAAAVMAPAVWTGDALFVRGAASLAVDGAATPAVYRYDPATDRWTSFPAPAGVHDTLDVTMTWTGRELVFWGHPFRRYDEPPLAVALDPSSGRWRELPAGPLPAGMGPSAAWNGREVVVVSGLPLQFAAGTQQPAAALDPATDSWRSLPPVDRAGPAMSPLLIADGSHLTVAGGSAGPFGQRDVARYDGTAWQTSAVLPGAGRWGQQYAWTGELVEVGGQTSTEALTEVTSVDPATGEVWPLAPLPEPRSWAAAVWTGDELLVWGGQPDLDGIDTALATGVRLALPARR